MEPQRITAEEARRRLNNGEPVVFIDARSDESWRKAGLQIPGSIRVPPDGVEAHLDDIPRQNLIVAYCT